MAKGAKAKDRRKRLYRDLTKVADEVFRMASSCWEQLIKDYPDAVSQYDKLDHYLTL